MDAYVLPNDRGDTLTMKGENILCYVLCIQELAVLKIFKLN